MNLDTLSNAFAPPRRPSLPALRIIGLSRLGRLWPMLSWAAASTISGAFVWLVQIRDRAPYLAWDEAARVRDGSDLHNYLSHGQLAHVWTWLNDQTFYPFVMPGLHGLLQFAGADVLTSAWLPSLVAYALAGLLAGRLAAALGTGQVGAWLAAMFYWCSPLAIRLAAWGAMEHVAACLFLALALALVRIETRPSWRLGLAAGVVAALAAFLKYDYGLIAAGTLFIAAPVSLLRHRRLEPLLVGILALLTQAGLVGFWLLFNHAAKIEMASRFIHQGQVHDGPVHAPTFYLQSLFRPEVGLSPLVALLFLVGAVNALVSVTRGRAQAAPTVLLLVALALYSRSQIKDVRFLAPLLAFFAVLAAAWLTNVAGWLAEHRPNKGLATATMVTFSLIGLWQIGAQLAGPNGARTRLPYLEPHASATAVIDFAAAHLRDERRPALLIGTTNWLSPRGLELAWSTARSGQTPPVYDMYLQGIQPSNRESFLQRQISGSGAGSVIGIDLAPSSTIFEKDPHYQQQREFLEAARDLEHKGTLENVGALSLESGAVQVDFWRVIKH